MTFVGVDVQMRRGPAVAVLDGDFRALETLWLPGDPEGAESGLAAVLGRFPGSTVGIDAPRTPLPGPRRWGFRAGRWRPEPGGRIGRHCEVAIRSLGLGNPQWTPVEGDAPGWMSLGFGLFRVARRAGCDPQEVFPSAAYRQMEGREVPPVSFPLSAMSRGPKDMVDAVAAAFVAGRWALGLGAAVGGGDGLGTILLPLPVEDHPVLRWPAHPGPGEGRGETGR